MSSLTILPSRENIVELKTIEKGSPFEMLYRYETTLLERESTRRALLLVGDSDQKDIINQWESLADDDWFILKMCDISIVPDNYFNIIAWSNCSPEKILKEQLQIAYNKIIKCGRIYILNFAERFSTFLESCLTSAERSYLDIETITQAIMDKPLKINQGHLILIKEQPAFELQDDLLKELQVEKLSPILLSGYKNVRNSCFMDSILFPMLAVPNNYFERSVFKSDKCESKIEEIKMVLFEQAQMLRGKRDLKLRCLPLLKYIISNNPNLSTFTSGEQQDDSEFLRALMDILNLNPVTIESNRYTSDDQKNWIQSSSIIEKVPFYEFYISENYKSNIDIIDWLQREKIENFQEKPIIEWPRDKEEKPHQFLKQVEKILKSQVIIIHVNRKIADQKIRRRITFSEYIKNGEEMLELTIATIHHGAGTGGHYTCYFKYQGEWFDYDDRLKGDRVTPASWDIVKQFGSTDCSLLVYEPINI